ncbi:hypothetical protein QBC43DRAFT_330598 [Cladorrhinum sp. PSN259]|nr:hypothetical protein QBC43DRAFT_330598 [Cladorrhinum sp. PSN259]
MDDSSSQESRSLSRADWRSTPSTVLDQDSRLSQTSTLLQESPTTDRFRHSLSNGWARFLNAAQSSQDIDSLKRSLDDHIRQTSSSIGSLQKDVAHRHELATTAVIETRSRTEQIAFKLEEIASLRSDIASLREDTKQSTIQNHKKFKAIQEVLETSCTLASQAAKAETVESLQDELQGLRAEKLDTEKRLASTENKLAALERQIETWKAQMQRAFIAHKHQVAAEQRLSEERFEAVKQQLFALEHQTKINQTDMRNQLSTLGHQVSQIPSQIPQEPSNEMLTFLGQLLGQRDNLARLLGSVNCEAGPLPTSEVVATPHNSQTPELPVRRPPKRRAGNNPPHPQPEPKRTSPVSSVDIRYERGSNEFNELKALYNAYRDIYKSKPPKSEVAFIWRFISNIDNPDISKYVQESLARALPEFVVELRGSSRQKKAPKKKRYISIAKGMTWGMFRQALIYLRPPIEQIREEV